MDSSNQAGSYSMALPTLPNGIQCLSHQVSGHVFSAESSKPKAGILECDDNTILKACQNNKRGMRELHFYETAFRNDDNADSLRSLRPHLPDFHGSRTLEAFPDVTFMKLGDITKRYNKPCIMDVKMGAITWDPEADADKIHREKAKYPYADEIGFHLLGMRVYDKGKDEYSFIKKQFLRVLKPEEIIPEGLAKYLNADSERFHRCIVVSLLQQLHHLKRWFQSQTSFLFYAASLLIVYEGQPAVHPRDCKKCAKFGYTKPFSLKNGLRIDSQKGLNDKRVLTDLISSCRDKFRGLENSLLRLKANGISSYRLKHKVDQLCVSAKIDSALSYISLDIPSFNKTDTDAESSSMGYDELQSTNGHIRSELEYNQGLMNPCIENEASRRIDLDELSSISLDASSIGETDTESSSLETTLTTGTESTTDLGYDSSFAENTKRFDRSFAENTERFNRSSTENKERFERSFTENTECFDRSFSENTECFDRSFADVRMIDFTHVFPAHGSRDVNYLYALESLIAHFEKILEIKRVLV